MPASPSVSVLTSNGRTVSLGHGDLIGRLTTAALHLPDPRVSEAHAMISLRGSALHLLALRGRFTVRGKTLAQVKLVPDMVIRLADGLTLTVLAVDLPAKVLAVRIGGMQERVLSGVCSLFPPPGPSLKSGFAPAAAAYVWPGDDTLIVRREGHPDQALSPGDSLDVDGVHLEVVEMALDSAGEYVTTARGAVAVSLEIVTRYDSVHIFRENRPALHLSGISAKILSELAAYGAPASWTTVATELWPECAADIAAGGQREGRIRARWDVNLSRMRKKLEAAGIRADLVKSDGHGNVELGLEKGDIVRDEA